MIRPININLNAAHPELPLVEATTFTGAPSSVFIRGVPKAVGNWSITAVSVAVTYPDNTTTARAAVESAEGVWVATIPGTATSGRTAAGFKIMADGIDENGAAVTGYVLGFADFSVLSFTPVPAPGGTFYLLRYFDTMPTAAKKGDVAAVGGVLKYYNGTTWLPFADLTNYYTKETVDDLLAGKASKSDVDPLLFAQYYPDGSVKSAAEFTAGIKYDDPDTVNRTITVKPFCNTLRAGADNTSLVGRVVIPPFVDAQGNPYISDDGTRFKVVGISDDAPNDESPNLTAIVAPTTVTRIGYYAFASCTSLTAVSLPAATRIEDWAFAFCTSLASIDFGDTPRLSVPALGLNVFVSVPNTCKIIVPYTQYDAWIAADGWKYLPQEFVRHAEKADKPAAFTTGNLASLDANGNPTDSLIPAANVALTSAIPYAISESIPLTVTSGAAATTLDDRTHNVRTVAAPGTGNTTTITATLPPIVAGKSRDMFLNLTVGTQASDAGDISLSIAEPSGATVQIDIGSNGDIGIGKNEILISENALPTTSGNVTTTHWLVTVRHEDFAS